MNANKSRQVTTKERSVFVGNIPYDVTEEMLKEIFSEAGEVLTFRLVTDRETGKPKGYGFCEYADGATALSAMRNLNGYDINGRNLRVDFADGGDKTSSMDKANSGITGEGLLRAIESAINRSGPLKLYDMLMHLKEHARQNPDYTKTILQANPVLTHAIVQCFKALRIPMPAPSQAAPPLLNMPPPHARPSQPPPSAGILGSAPTGNGPPQPAPAPSKPSRWGGRSAQPPSQPPPSVLPTPAPAPAASRDPRRARDPRKRAAASPDHAQKRMKTEDNNDEMAMIAELAKDMTPDKMNMLPPNERQIIMQYMQQYGIQYSG